MKIEKNKTTLNLIIQMVAVPALIELLDQIKNGSNEFDEANLLILNGISIWIQNVKSSIHKN